MHVDSFKKNNTEYLTLFYTQILHFEKKDILYKTEKKIRC